VRSIDNFPSAILGNSRKLRLYLPPDYETNRKARYPVLYLQDGQNLFDPSLSPFSHAEWRVDETAEALIRAKLIPPMIIVGIDNTPARADEFLPTRRKLGNQKAGGNADGYLKFLLTEVKPYIDAHYRTKADRENTAIGGSSLGGVLTLYAGLSHPEAFSKLLVISPSFWWDDRVMLKKVQALHAKLPLKIWVDIGTRENGFDQKENAQTVKDVEDVVQALEAKGWKPGRDLDFYVDHGAEHSEVAWARRFGMMLMALYR
jgi:predicted alpha/beta superfamily hydrolase